ncbi:sodium:calcium antiporter [bacterium]|nr:sodium:calcium antiporter [bacterium]
MIFGEGGIWLIIEFVLCASVIFFAGSKLSLYGDQIGKRTGLGQIWIGIMILAMLTSLPELVTNIGAVTIAGQPDLALGNVLGSNLFNLAIIAFLDILHKKKNILTHVRTEHILSAGFGILLMGLVIAAIVLTKVIGLYGDGLGYTCSFLILSIYLTAIYLNNRLGRSTADIIEKERSNRQKETKTEDNQVSKMSDIKVISIFFITAVIVVAAGIWLVKIGDSLSSPFYLFNLRIDLGATFVGSLFLAFATSLPEVAVTAGAVKIGAFDMAISNVLGSNLFNMFIIPISDVFYRGNNIFLGVSSVHVLTAVFGIILTSLVIIGLIHRSKKVFLYVSWDTISIIVVYLLGMFILFQARNLVV